MKDRISHIIFNLILLILCVFLGYMTFPDYNNPYDAQTTQEPMIDANQEWIVIITTCISPHGSNTKEDDINYRKSLYEKQIKRWLEETNLPIFVVESSGYGFDNLLTSYKDKRKLVVVTFHQENDDKSTTIKERNSVRYLLDHIQTNDEYRNCKYVLKVTGKYFLEHFEDQIPTFPKDKDMFLQKKRDENTKIQHCEFFGMRKELLPDFLDSIDKHIMERELYDFSSRYSSEFIGPFVNTEKVNRGDGSVLETL
mgnify:CR=1 FL=1